MECPHCKSKLKVDTTVFMNADIYSRSNLIVTECCGKSVVLTPVRTYSVSEYKGERTEDDWGNEIKK